MKTFKMTVSDFMKEITDDELKVAEFFFRKGFESGFDCSLHDTSNRIKDYNTVECMIAADKSAPLERSKQVYLMIHATERREDMIERLNYR
jgi:hypothetical protein